MDYKQELINYFEILNTNEKWGLSPEHAATLCFASAETYLRQHTIDDYVSFAQTVLEGESYDAKGEETEFEINESLESAIRKACAESPYASMERKYTDLSQATEIELPDGRTVSINRK